jgi:hypothetical protein
LQLHEIDAFERVVAYFVMLDSSLRQGKNNPLSEIHRKMPGVWAMYGGNEARDSWGWNGEWTRPFEFHPIDARWKWRHEEPDDWTSLKGVLRWLESEKTRQAKNRRGRWSR